MRQLFQGEGMENHSLVILAALAAVVVVSVWWYVATMNAFARLAVKIEESDSGIDVALSKRFSTLTKMLEVTKAYAKHEAETLGNLVTLRSGMSMAERSAANSRMNELEGRINVLAENYPSLRSSENFVELQHAVMEVEEHLQAARRVHNMNVSAFNRLLASWPAGVVGRSRGCAPMEFFAAEEREKRDVEMKFGEEG